MLQDPPVSDYDLHFELFGFRVRIAWSFWLGALIFGFYLVRAVDDRFIASGDGSPGKLALLILWALCMLVSILIHELGHAFAFRQFGIQSSIVLYHFGGLAIPSSTFGTGRGSGQLNEKQDLWVALAGPLAQIVSAMLLVGVFVVSGFRVEALAWIDSVVPLGLTKIPGVMEGDPITSSGLYALVLFYTFPSVLWALLNLVPVWPLDGGRIMNSLVLLNGGRREQALWISVFAAGLLTLYAFNHRQTFMGILFLSLAFSNYQMLQQTGRWR
ncbi:Peptidase family M50 [Novipirellula galeiformis]|uniref:Peptidase family M50 n=1 Tax=Novipirellula galeiformis TaxID=2528004 RepID=A0A5C6C741_9BACT|nr:site-2 protease family protein [Novipirellula galeiformis]TWU20460.1 Peptidase family M50 [Novipirellula galeiformis]